MSYTQLTEKIVTTSPNQINLTFRFDWIDFCKLPQVELKKLRTFIRKQQALGNTDTALLTNLHKIEKAMFWRDLLVFWQTARLDTPPQLPAKYQTELELYQKLNLESFPKYAELYYSDPAQWYSHMRCVAGGVDWWRNYYRTERKNLTGYRLEQLEYKYQLNLYKIYWYLAEFMNYLNTSQTKQLANN